MVDPQPGPERSAAPEASTLSPVALVGILVVALAILAIAALFLWTQSDTGDRPAIDAPPSTEADQRPAEPQDETPAEDRTLRAIETARREIARDPHFKDLEYDAVFSSPYLLCYSLGRRIPEDEFSKLSPEQRLAEKMRVDAERSKSARVLAEKARIFTQLYAEFLRRYREPCGLRSLMDDYGGRNDLPPGRRSFQDGCPLIVWIFSDRKAWDQAHGIARRGPVALSVAGYISPPTGWVDHYDEDENREFEINKTVAEGTRQLVHWFQRQKRDWKEPITPQTFFSVGFAEYVGAVTMAPDRSLAFHGLNRPRLQYLKATLRAAASESRTMPTFPLKDLVSFERYDSVVEWGRQHGFLDPFGVFYAQSWAFVYFLNEFENHKYQSKFNQFLNAMLLHPEIDSPSRGYAAEQFKKHLGIRSADDWVKLHKEFAGWYEKDLIPMDTSKLGGEPPSLDDWPGFEPLAPLAPLAK